MNPDEARGSLDDIRRLQDRTRGEYIRHGFARPYLLTSVFGLFIALASFDFPSPWQLIVFLLGEGVMVGVVIVQRRRAPVRRNPTAPVVLFNVGVGVALLAVYVAYSIAAALGVQAFDLPMQHTIVAAAVTLTVLVAVAPARRLFDSIVPRG